MTFQSVFLKLLTAPWSTHFGESTLSQCAHGLEVVNRAEPYILWWNLVLRVCCTLSIALASEASQLLESQLPGIAGICICAVSSVATRIEVWMALKGKRSCNPNSLLSHYRTSPETLPLAVLLQTNLSKCMATCRKTSERWALCSVECYQPQTCSEVFVCSLTLKF